MPLCCDLKDLNSLAFKENRWPHIVGQDFFFLFCLCLKLYMNKPRKVIAFQACRLTGLAKSPKVHIYNYMKWNWSTKCSIYLPIYSHSGIICEWLYFSLNQILCSSFHPDISVRVFVPRSSHESKITTSRKIVKDSVKRH